MEASINQIGSFTNWPIFFYSLGLVFLVNYFLNYKRGGTSDSLFINIAIAAVVFQVCILLKTLHLDLGFAFGLFAIFSLIRFRTNMVDSRELAYLFVSVGIAVLDGLITDESFSYILFWDMLLVVVIAFADIITGKLVIKRKSITYEKIDLIQEDRYEELKEDLCKRLSIGEIKKIKIGDVNFSRDTVQLVVYFKDKNGRN